MFKSNILYSGLFPFASMNDTFPHWNMVRFMRTGAVDCINGQSNRKRPDSGGTPILAIGIE